MASDIGRLVKSVSMETPSTTTRMRLVGGNLALDFVNTRTGPPTGAPDGDALTGYAELVAWGVYAGALDEIEAAHGTRLARKDPVAAETAFARSLRLRDDLDAIFRALAKGRRPSTAALSRLRDDEADALAHARLERRTAFDWTWQEDRTAPRVLRPVAHAATQLLIGGELDRIKVCAGCRFIFADETKNRGRRWCSMQDCGTAEKVRRYVEARRLRASG
jgi:predicted RNA-binding Zn ribbon-like protein